MRIPALWMFCTLAVFAQDKEKMKAPEFPDGLDWINTDRPLKLADLKGKIVLLDFWTYG